MTVPWSPIPCAVDREGRAVGRVDHEVGLVDVDLDRAHPDRDAADDRGTVSESGDDLGGQRVDVEGDPDDDDAVVVGAGERRRHGDERERRALERARRGTSSRPRGRGGRRGRRRRWWCRSGSRRGQLGWPARRGPGSAPRRRSPPPGSRLMPRRLPVKPGGMREVEVAEELVAVIAVELQGEVAEVAGDRVRGAGDETRAEGTDLARARAAVRARGDRRSWFGVLRREHGRSRGRSRLRPVERAAGRRRDQAAVGGEEVEVELLERDLRQVDQRRPSADRSAGRDGRWRPASRGSRSRRRS